MSAASFCAPARSQRAVPTLQDHAGPKPSMFKPFLSAAPIPTRMFPGSVKIKQTNQQKASELYRILSFGLDLGQCLLKQGPTPLSSPPGTWKCTQNSHPPLSATGKGAACPNPQQLPGGGQSESLLTGHQGSRTKWLEQRVLVFYLSNKEKLI